MSKKKDEKVIVCYNCGKKCKIHKCPCGAEDWQCVCGYGSGHTHEKLPDKNIKCVELKEDRKGLENWDKQALIEEFEIAIGDEITLKKFIKNHCDLIFDYDDKQIDQLKQQLAEKDKDIERLKSVIDEMVNKVSNANQNFSKTFRLIEKQFSHQICEKIRETAQEHLFCYIIDKNKLDQIEKGE